MQIACHYAPRRAAVKQKTGNSRAGVRLRFVGDHTDCHAERSAALADGRGTPSALGPSFRAAFGAFAALQRRGILSFGLRAQAAPRS
jgi:hypothetical protein